VIVAISEDLAGAFGHLRPLSPELALGAVAAINELVLRADDIRAVAPVAVELLQRLVLDA
jgi:hypothetical protein